MQGRHEGDSAAVCTPKRWGAARGEPSGYDEHTSFTRSIPSTPALAGAGGTCHRHWRRLERLLADDASARPSLPRKRSPADPAWHEPGRRAPLPRHTRHDIDDLRRHGLLLYF